MRVAVYRLQFPHGVHVGKHGIGTEGVRPTIPADTLFSALLSAWISLGNKPEQWISHFPRTENEGFTAAQAPFLLTSAFPYIGSVLLFPKSLDPELARAVPEEHRKDWKKVNFVSESVSLAIAKGKTAAELFENEGIQYGSEVLISKGDEKDLPPKEAEFWKEQKIPRVTLDRISSASNLYYVGRVDFAKSAGLWFGVIWRNPHCPCGDLSFREAFELALKGLSHSGIGGDRTAGYGIFEYELMDEFDWPDPELGKPALLLSRYLPCPDELPDVLWESEGYALEEVRGWTSSPHGQYRRRSIVMVKEGSVLRPKKDVMGHVVDVGPIHIETGKPLLPHPVWRYGLAALWPLGGEG